MTLLPLAPLEVIDDATLAALRGRVVSAGFDAELAAFADRVVPGPVRALRLPVVRHALASRREPGADLLRLFGYDDALERTRVRELLGDAVADALAQAGVLVEDAGRVRARLLLSAMPGAILLASDSLSGGADAVMGPSAGTAFLAALVPPSPGAVLDIGCGAGSLAIVAAKQGATRSVGVDINPRAVQLARWNARLNAVAVEVLEGDVVAPLGAHAPFDLVVSQPPFVPRPPGSGGIVYLHGGAVGDELSLRILAAAPGVLGPGGRALVSFLSPAREGSLAERLGAHLGAAAANLLVLRLRGPAPALQAVTFAACEAPELGEAYDAAVARYLAHFDAQRVREVEGLLAIVERLPAGATADDPRYVRALPCDQAALEPADLEAALHRMRSLSLDDAALGAQRVRLDGRARMIEERRGVDAAVTIRIVFSGGLGVGGEVLGAELEVLRALHAASSVDRAVEAVARGRRVAPSRVRAEVLEVLRKALVRGWVRLAGPG